VIGKHSGTHSIIAKFREYNYELTPKEAEEMLRRVRVLAINLKRSLFDKELVHLYEDFLEEEKGE
jgi:homocitrate synthase NifV